MRAFQPVRVVLVLLVVVTGSAARAESDPIALSSSAYEPLATGADEVHPPPSAERVLTGIGFGLVAGVAGGAAGFFGGCYLESRNSADSWCFMPLFVGVPAGFLLAAPFGVALGAHLFDLEDVLMPAVVMAGTGLAVSLLAVASSFATNSFVPIAVLWAAVPAGFVTSVILTERFGRWAPSGALAGAGADGLRVGVGPGGLSLEGQF